MIFGDLVKLSHNELTKIECEISRGNSDPIFLKDVKNEKDFKRKIIINIARACEKEISDPVPNKILSIIMKNKLGIK